MRFSTLLLLACGGVALFAILNDNKGGARLPSGTGPSPAAAPSPSSTDSSSSGVLSSALAFFKRGLSAATIHRTSWQRGELRIARGTVVDQLDTGLVLNCSGWVVQSATHPGVYAGDGPGMNALYANLVDAHERLQYGRLLTVDHGSVRQSAYAPAMWTPESYLYGPVLVEGYPAGSPGHGRGIKVVVAPDGSATWRVNSIPAYTASFTIAN